jgi:hypothetical protein
MRDIRSNRHSSPEVREKSIQNIIHKSPCYLTEIMPLSTSIVNQSINQSIQSFREVKD